MFILKNKINFNCLLSIRRFNSVKMTEIKAILIDLSGTVHVDDDPTPNAIEALEKLRTKNIPIRFVTNTTKESGQTLYNRLINIGFHLNKSEIFSSLSAAANYVIKEQLKPFYLLSRDARNDFPAMDDNIPVAELNAVVVGLATNEFYYENLNKAFSILLRKCPLIAIHEGKYYRSSDGIVLGPGCFTRGLEYAASTKAIVVGKPNRYFFESAIPHGINVNECLMIGDDPNDDIKGAMSIGMKGILVKTGKYMADVVVEPPPTATVDNFSAAVDLLLEKNVIL